jgi:hypothetical protein
MKKIDIIDMIDEEFEQFEEDRKRRKNLKQIISFESSIMDYNERDINIQQPKFKKKYLTNIYVKKHNKGNKNNLF